MLTPPRKLAVPGIAIAVLITTSALIAREGQARSQEILPGGDAPGDGPRMILENAPAGLVTAVAWSAQCPWVAAGAIDGTVRFIDPESGETRICIQADHGEISTLTFSPDGKKVLTAGSFDDGYQGNKNRPAVKFWDRETGNVLASFGLSSESGNVATLSPDGQSVATTPVPGERRFPGTNKVLSIWNLKTGVLEGDLNEPQTDMETTQEAAYSPNGKYLAVLESEGQTGKVLIFDAVSSELIRALAVPGYSAEAMAWSPGSRSLAVSYSNAKTGLLRIWSISSGQSAHDLTTGTPDDVCDVTALAWSHDGTSLAAARNQSVTGNIADISTWRAFNFLQIWDTRTQKLRDRWPEQTGANLNAAAFDDTTWDASFTCLAFSPDDPTLVSGGGLAEYQSGALDFWNVSTGQLMRAIGNTRIHRGHSSIALVTSEDGRLAEAFSARSSDGSPPDNINLWNLTTGRLEASLATDNEPSTSVAFSADNKYLAAGTMGDPPALRGKLHVWNRLSYQPVPQIPDVGGIDSIDFSPDSHELVSAGQEVHLWRTATWRPFLELLQSHTDTARFSPDGKMLTTLGEDGDKLVLAGWDAGSGHNKWRLHNENLGGFGVEFTPDGAAILKGNLWNAQTGVAMQNYSLGSYEEGFAFRPNSSTSLAGSGEVAQIETHGQLELQGLPNRVSLTTLHQPEDIRQITFSRDGRLIITDSVSGKIRAWSANHDTLLATMETLASRRAPDGQEITDWITYTPDGYYDCSPGGAQYIRWRVNGQLLPAAAEAATYNRPDLVAAAFSN